MNDYDERIADDAGDWRYIADEIKIELVIERRDMSCS
jgi:hypothetical protein